MGIRSKIDRLGDRLKRRGRDGAGIVDGVTILTAMKASVERRKKFFKDRTFAPERFTVFISNTDMADLQPIAENLKEELVEEIGAYINGKGYRTGSRDIGVDFQVRHTFEPGSLKVVAAFGTAEKNNSPAGQITVTLTIDPGTPDEDIVGLQAGVHTLGRGTEADVLMPEEDSLISKIHCRLEITADEVGASDLNSANGTLVNGRRIRDRQVLHAGDRLMLGNTEIEVRW